MIYSKKHNFILFKNYKVGGTSLEVELSQALDESAVITPIAPPNILHKPRNVGLFYNHISYSEAEKILGEDVLSNAESAVFVRNPFDSVLSHMYMSLIWGGVEDPSQLDVDKYFNNEGTLARLTGLKSRSIYTKNESIATKHVYRYEDGLDQINILLEKVGIGSISIAAYEKAYKPKHIKPRDVFSQKHIDIISQDWSWEIDKFGYQI
jgi:hypothetical protein